MAKAKKKKDLSNMSQWGLILFRFRKNKLAVFGLCFIILIMILCLAAPLYISYEEVYNQNMMSRFISPCLEHPLGTDQYGRDLLARIIYGGRISLLCGLLTVIISLSVGIVIGGIAGYFGGWGGTIIMRICDVFMAVPRMLLAMAVVAALGQGTFKMLIALSVAAFPNYARTVRASIMNLRNQEFVEAARNYGTNPFKIIFKHVLPNGLGPVIVSATIGLGSTIITIASLGFLGIGVASPTPEWGTILAENRANIRFFPYLGLIPGAFIAISVMCLNFIGDGLRDAMDPRMKN